MCLLARMLEGVASCCASARGHPVWQQPAAGANPNVPAGSQPQSSDSRHCTTQTSGSSSATAPMAPPTLVNHGFDETVGFDHKQNGGANRVAAAAARQRLQRRLHHRPAAAGVGRACASGAAEAAPAAAPTGVLDAEQPTAGQAAAPNSAPPARAQRCPLAACALLKHAPACWRPLSTHNALPLLLFTFHPTRKPMRT